MSLRPGEPGTAQLHAAVFFDVDADVPAHETTVTASLYELRPAVHRLVDELMGALTGERGPFVSRLTFVAQRGDTRTMRIDGHHARKIANVRGDSLRWSRIGASQRPAP